jgi:hypothetical protein
VAFEGAEHALNGAFDPAFAYDDQMINPGPPHWPFLSGLLASYDEFDPRPWGVDHGDGDRGLALERPAANKGESE